MDSLRGNKGPRLSTAKRAYRGSLFTHQELAIASYLELDIIAFHERGILESDGMRRVMQLNSELFSNRKKLAGRVMARVEKSWSSEWRNELVITLPIKKCGYSKQPTGPGLFFYHLVVRNMHRSKIAHDCSVFVESWENLGTKELRQYETVPLKWGGAVTPTATILPKGVRTFDAFQIFQEQPSRVIFQGFSDSGSFDRKSQLLDHIESRT